MQKIKVRFFEAGKWADEPKDPVFDVKANEVKEVSLELATVVTNAKKGELYVAPKVDPEAKAAAGKTPAVKDKAKSQGK